MAKTKAEPFADLDSILPTDHDIAVETKNELTRRKRQHYWQSDRGRTQKKIVARTRSAMNHSLYASEYEVRSPGNDLLDFYDQQNLLLGPGRRSAIPPSVIFRVRFRTKLPKTRSGANQTAPNITSTVREICRPYKETKDTSYWHQVLKTKMDWLVDTPAQRWRFTYHKDALAHIEQQIGHRPSINPYNPRLDYAWFRGAAKGWSIVCLDRSHAKK